MSRALGWIRAAACVALAAVALPAEATTFRRPFDENINLGYGYDHNGAAPNCQDYACGGKCYDGHRGNDFPVPIGTTIRAAADGTVTAVNQGCPDIGFVGSTCGGGYGNYVRLQHADGKWTYYAHQKNGSIVVSVGQQVKCGDKLGLSATSGNSSGPHVHFEPRVGGVAADPFAGNCNGPTSFWVSQGPYNGTPGSTCENGGSGGCDCQPGQVQEEGCGNCGHHARSCGGNCKWGGFGSCDGQGECSPGANESQACGQCGHKTRACGGNCSWGGYGDCNGPDPDGGNQKCTTEIPGPCADGRVRCVGGDLKCLTIYKTSAEVCDDIDNDCNGAIDDGEPQKLGDPRPALAATVVDLSYPQSLGAGELGTVWARVRNDGTAVWPRHTTWLGALGQDGKPSKLYSPGAWPAYDVAAVLDRDVPMGDTALFRFDIRGGSEGERVNERFVLGGSDGSFLRCPAPGFALALLTTAAPPPEPPATPPADPPTCTAAPVGHRTPPPWLLLALALTAPHLRRRPRHA